jgi:ArsR family transcriptional regulator, virulence genes transcriptional regulator
MAPRPSAVDAEFDLRGFELEADLIRVLANPKRLMILNLLARGPTTVTEIARQLHLSLQNTSQHLRLMKDRSIVRAHRDGREVRYALTSPVFSKACSLVRQALVAEARARPTHLRSAGRASAGLAETGRARLPVPATS